MWAANLNKTLKGQNGKYRQSKYCVKNGIWPIKSLGNIVVHAYFIEQGKLQEKTGKLVFIAILSYNKYK